MKRILVIDEQEIIRDAMRYYFKDDQKFCIIAEAESIDDALWLLEHKKPIDLIITEIYFTTDGQDYIKKLKDKFPVQKILVFSILRDSDLIYKMIKLGIRGYLLKEKGKKELTEALDMMVSGKYYFSHEVYTVIIDRIAGKKHRDPGHEVDFSAREKEILLLIAAEYSNKEIADKLFLSVRTIETHKRNLFEKTGCKSTVGLVKYVLNRDMMSVF